MKKIFILVICLLVVMTVRANACDPGNSPDSGAAAAPSADVPGISAATPSAAPAPAADAPGISAAAPSAAAAPSPSASPAAAVSGGDLGGLADGGIGVDQSEFAIAVSPDCKWIIWGHCVNPVVGEDYNWLVDGEPWYKVIK